MDYQELRRQLPAKERTVNDLVRYIKTRTDGHSNYNLLFGAGCSITSGVRSASALIEVWRREILELTPGGCDLLGEAPSVQREFLRQHHSDWYDPAREYSSLFERRYDLQRQRRMFVESEVSRASPSIGYAYLTALVAEGYFRNIFTTNFDDLINEAFYSYSSERPIVCAHDSSISSVTVTSKRPKIIKLHGDYLFDDLKSTIRETESLEINMRSKFSEFAKEAGLIVVGYSGADRSIMDIFSSLLKNEEYFKGGVYWCLRPDSEVSEELRRLLWRERVYFVRIEGFDELFGDLFSDLTGGDCVPPSLLGIARPSGVVDRLLKSPAAIPETTKVLSAAKRRLSSLTKRSAIAGLIVQSNSDDGPALRGQPQEFTDDELLILTEVSGLLSEAKYDAAIEKIGLALQGDCRLIYRRRLLREQIQGFRLKGENLLALQVIEQLVSLNPRRGSNYLLRANIEVNEARKLEAIEKAIAVEPHLPQAHLDLAEWNIRAADRVYGESARRFRDSAVVALRKSIDLNPYRANPAWLTLGDLLHRTFGDDKVGCKSAEDNLLSDIRKQGGESYYCLNLGLEIAKRREDEKAIDSILSVLADVEERHGLESVIWVADLRFDAYAARCDVDSIRRLVAVCERDGIFRQSPETVLAAARAIRASVGDDDLAARLLSEALRGWDFNGDVLIDLFRLYLDMGRSTEARRLYEVWGNRLVDKARLALLTDLLETEGDFDSALQVLEERELKTGSKYIVERTYVLLQASRFSEAERVARSFLESYNFTPEAHVEIINFELARKLQGRRPDNNRLDAILRLSASPNVSSAVYALLGRRDEMVKSIRKAIKKDKAFRYCVARWPVFGEFRSDPDVIAALAA
ncbi:SIR2 family protein [Rubrivivax sp. JA1026]|uniref:SIR2 family protein n=1 Tax=Rubrivivax sp. JA1026 TaxID=2710888 RepID=UPI0013E96051|nr:SIR2 family protein [Rubrivivax sp. JA1026]